MKYFLETKIYMNTHISIHIYSSKEKEFVMSKIKDAFSMFEYVVKKYSRFDPSSELSIMNSKSGNETEISSELYMLIKHSLDVAKLSDGAFDPTIIDILEAYGYTAKYDFDKLKNREILEKEIGEIVKKRPSYKDIILEERNSKFYITLKKSQRIDLGGCGKGYAIDLAYEALSGLESYMIDAGGDIRCFGLKDDKEKWNIGLYNPDDPNKPLGQVELESGESIACSGSFARKVDYFHHLINPKTGKPEDKHKVCFVTAKNALIADTFATVSYIMGEESRKILPPSTKLLLS